MCELNEWFFVCVFVAIQVFIHPKHEVSIILRTLAAIILIIQGLLHNFQGWVQNENVFKKQGKMSLKVLAFFFLWEFFPYHVVFLFAVMSFK